MTCHRLRLRGYSFGGDAACQTTGCEEKTSNVGVRVDLRRLHALQDLKDLALPLRPLSDLKRDFNRGRPAWSCGSGAVSRPV